MNPLAVFASFFWSAVGLGYFLYGKKRQRLSPMVGGIILMISSFILKTTFSISIAGVVLMTGIYLLNKRY